MKKIFAVALLLMSFASAAVADGPGTAPPPVKKKLLTITVVQLVNGPGNIPPPGKTIKPSAGRTTA
ncbi:MAG TPA: hypothetical protein VIH89_07435 [Candidatus Sulfotelmatobacter sp.]